SSISMASRCSRACSTRESMISRLSPLICPSLAEPITKAVRGNDVENLPRGPVVLFDGILGQLLLESVGLEFREQCLEVLDVKGTTVLRGISAVFGKPNLNLVPDEHGCVAWDVAARLYPEAEDGFVEWQGRCKVSHGKIHAIALVAICLFESCTHYRHLCR